MVAEKYVRLLLLFEAETLRYTFRREVLPDITPINSVISYINKDAIIHGEILFEFGFELPDFEILIGTFAWLGEVFGFDGVTARAQGTILGA